tara:strand:- start:420 stop:530 length:111 start_codon:yes stop_codon:yes gene_type:complete
MSLELVVEAFLKLWRKKSSRFSLQLEIKKRKNLTAT